MSPEIVFLFSAMVSAIALVMLLLHIACFEMRKAGLSTLDTTSGRSVRCSP